VLDRLLVLRLGEQETRQQEVIWVDEIFFAFQGTYAARRLVGARWAKGNEFQEGRVYVRTETGVFPTTFRSIKDFRRHLPGHFEPVNRGILVNMHHVRWSELFREHRKTLGFYFSDEDTGRNREWVVLSRRGARRVRDNRRMDAEHARKRCALPKRGRRVARGRGASVAAGADGGRLEAGSDSA
jgi:hypothetical protein